MSKWLDDDRSRRFVLSGCAVGVNLISYRIFRTMGTMDLVSANLLSILLSMIFICGATRSIRFVGRRLVLMAAETAGVLFLCQVWELMGDMAAKLFMQAVILLLNAASRACAPKERAGMEPGEKRRMYRIVAAGFAAPAGIVLIGFAANAIFPVGDNIVLIIDSLHQYLPFYTELHEKLVSGESLLYSFSGGLGFDFWSTIAYYMACPLNLVLALFPTENVADVMDLLILVKIGLCGAAFTWYLYRRNSQKSVLPVAFGTMFALSNFVIGYYFNLMWLDSIALLPVIMAGVERIVKGESGRTFAWSLGLALWCNYYIGFMLCIFACLYFVVQWLCANTCTIRRFFKSCASFAWYALLSGGMAAAALVPAFMSLQASESMESNSFPSTIRFYVNGLDLLLSHLAALEPVTISDSQVGLNVFCGSIMLILVVMYVLDERIRLRERLARTALAGLLLLSFAFNMLNYIWHGFHTQNGLPNRFAFIYVAVILVMGYDVIGHVRDFFTPRIIFAAVVPAGFLATAWITECDTEIPWYAYAITLGLMLVYLIILLAGRLTRIRLKPFCRVLSGFLLAEMTASGIFGIIQNGNVTRSIYLNDQASYKRLIAGAEPEGSTEFYRSEVDSQRMRNVSMFVGANSMIMFNSTMPASTVELCKALGIEARTNKNGYIGVTKLMNDVFGIRYVASSKGKGDTLYQFEKVAEDEPLTLYRNDNALSLGFMVNRELEDWQLGDKSPLEVQNDFVKLATGLEGPFILDRYIELEDGETYTIRIPENKQVYLCLENRVEQIKLTTPEFDGTYDTYTDHLYVINTTDGKEGTAEFTVKLKDNQDSVQMKVYTCANTAYEAITERLAGNQLTGVRETGNRVTGQITAQTDGLLLLTVPYDEDWQISVDGQPADAVCIGEALTGIELAAGSHELEMTYTPRGMWPGTAISLICIGLYFASGIAEKRKKGQNDGRICIEESADVSDWNICSAEREEGRAAKGGEDGVQPVGGDAGLCDAEADNGGCGGGGEEPGEL